MHTRLIYPLLLAATLLTVLIAPSAALAGNWGLAAHQVYPNPFTEGTVFQLTMPKSSRIRISVYNLQGQLVRTLWEGVHPEGQYDVPWDGKDANAYSVPPGIYICVLFSEDVAVKSVKVIKAQS